MGVYFGAPYLWKPPFMDSASKNYTRYGFWKQNPYRGAKPVLFKQQGPRQPTCTLTQSAHVACELRFDRRGGAEQTTET